MKTEPRSPWVIGLLCILATLALGSSGHLTVAPLIIAALIGANLVFGRPTMPRPRSLLAFVMLIPFGLWYRSYGSAEESNSYVPVTFLYMVGLYMMALAAHHVLSIRHGGSRDYALACAVMGMGMAGTAARNVWYLPLLAMFIPLLLWHLREELFMRHWSDWRRAPLGRLGLALGILATMVLSVQFYVVDQIPRLNEWAVQQLLRGGSRGSVGFDRKTDLNTISGIWGAANDPTEQEIMVRVFAEHKPDPYLRGAVYDRYYDGAWRIIDERQPLFPSGTYLGRRIFNTLSADSEDYEATVYPDRQFSDTFFLPLGVHKVASFADRARYGSAYTIRPTRGSSTGGYCYFGQTAMMPGPTDADLHLPSNIEDDLVKIAHQIMHTDRSPAQNAADLAAYFKQNFTYQRGMKRTNLDKDPVLEFLEDEHKGHCEYFATASTLLLRAMGIPARYVTGFVADEEGLEGIWLARRKDAHAWVEAYLGPQAGWTVVETTPPSARPATKPLDTSARLSEWVGVEWDRIMQLMLHGGFKALMLAIWDWLVALPQRVPIWAWLMMIAAGVAWVFREDLRTAMGRGRGAPIPPHVVRLRAQLAQAERKLARHGVIRPPGMTVGRYLQMVRAHEPLPDALRREAMALLDEYQRERFRAH
ncbi:MAG: hypothetical protein GC162_02850 [Planctomycetes bacterium]|nr:hypothetical protein [Planctomycetota bacterium]